MKQMKIYIFLIIYTFSCIGFIVDFHYCGGEQVSITLYPANEDGCCGEHEENEKNCCKDKYLLVDTDDSENLKSTTVSNNNFLRNINPVYYPTVIALSNGFAIDKKKSFLKHPPPDIGIDLLNKTTILRV